MVQALTQSGQYENLGSSQRSINKRHFILARVGLIITECLWKINLLQQL